MYLNSSCMDQDFILYVTLRDRLKGAVNHAQAHEAGQLLTPTEKKAVIRCIERLEESSFPPKPDHVKQGAKLLLQGHPVEKIDGLEVGKNWLGRFLKRHTNHRLASQHKSTTNVLKQARIASYRIITANSNHLLILESFLQPI